MIRSARPGRAVVAFVAACLLLAAAPAFAQVDLSGTWSARVHEDQPERGPGPEIGDYLGLPITDGARARGASWDASLLTLPEYQCRPHPSDYGPRHSHLRIWMDVDVATQRAVAIRTHREWQGVERTLYLDGRAHPPDHAAHTWQGFSTAVWEGPMLKVTTTHLKPGYIRRNGIPRSDQARLTEYYARHGNYLTITTIVEDAVYLTEPFVRTSDYELDLTRQIAPYPCQPVVEVERPQGEVPHHLPGTNPYLTEFATRHGLPMEATMGGAETMYPEYMRKLGTPRAVPSSR